METWDFPEGCENNKYECYHTMTSPPTCIIGDKNCYVGFLRAMCADVRNYDSVCDTKDFRDALKKKDECLPGVNYCIGFQTMFGGPREDAK